VIIRKLLSKHRRKTGDLTLEALTERLSRQTVGSGVSHDGRADSLLVVIVQNHSKIGVIDTFLLQAGISRQDVGVGSDVVTGGADFVVRCLRIAVLRI
jgi:hypothetical protein